MPRTRTSFVVRNVSALGKKENRLFEKGAPELWVKAMHRWSSLGGTLGPMLERFRSQSADGIEALVVCPRYTNAKGPARGPEGSMRGILLAACVLTGLVVKPLDQW